MHHRSLHVITLSLAALLACNQARQPASERAEAGACTGCHGGGENQTGAPPLSLHGERDASAMAVGAHSRHVVAGPLSRAFACAECHPDPRAGSSVHFDGKVELAFGALATEPGAGAAAPSFDRASGTCASVYCHGAFTGGDRANAPVWNSGSPAACGSCHGAPPPPPHPASGDCGRCHSGYTATTVNLTNHVNGAVDLDGLSCASCHGDPGRSSNAAAPPLGTHGETATTERAVGAHQAHLGGATLGTPVACAECHVPPTSLTHADGTVDLRFGALATAGGTVTARWDGATCSNYCHGATLNAGGTNPAPRWTGGAGEAACGSCHAVPPPAPHPSVSGLDGCAFCHPETMTAAGALIPAASGGKHLDGTIQSAGHPAGWMEFTSPAFHAFSANADLASCTACHGAALDGGPVQVACARCHDLWKPAGVASWRQDCTMCHGNRDDAPGTPGIGAPPRATWGNEGDPVRVGAHQSHVTGSAIAPPFDCGVCHVKPEDALSPGHVDGPTATVTFGGLATVGAVVPPDWDRTTATCGSTYCHGGTMGGGTNPRPVWTNVGTGEASCGSCHGLPPPAPHPAVSGITSCAGCHPDTVDADGSVIPPASGGKHLDGVVEAASGHGPNWMDQASTGFHAYSADAGLASCQACHGQRLDALAGGNCASCHGASWPTSCTMCHGGTDNQTGAPPRTIYGRGADAVRVGAHTAHLAGGPIAPPFGCSVCHVVPADAFTTGHIDQGTATVTFGGVAVPAPGEAPAPGWDRASATCSSTYCHGATLTGGSNPAPVWTGGASQVACGSCHGTPPLAPHPAVSGGLAGCATCHNGTVAADGTLIPPASGGKHLNGQVDAGSLEQGCSSCHGSPPADGGINGHLFHNSLRLECATCHLGYTRTSANAALHMNGTRDAIFTYSTPNPDPGLGSGTAPTLEACLATPLTATVRMPPSSDPTTWDGNVCATCHTARDYRFNACCVDPGAPTPAWCADW